MRVLDQFRSKARRAWVLPLLSMGLVMFIALVPVLALPGAAAGQDHPPAGALAAGRHQSVSDPRSPGASQATPEPPSDRQRYSRGDSNIQFRWGMLVDSLALGVSYVWLCCGALVVLALPVFFVVLWVKGRNRRS